MTCLGHKPPQLAGKSAQTDFAFAQRTGGIALAFHACLDARDKRGIFRIHLPVDPPIEVAGGLHLPAIIRQRIADFADQRLGRGNGKELHEIDLIGINIEGHIGPELEIKPMTLAAFGQVGNRRQKLLIGALRDVGRRPFDQITPHPIDMVMRFDPVTAPEQAGQPGVRDRDVKAIGIIVGHVFPVHGARAKRDPAKRPHLGKTVGRDHRLIRRHHLRDTGAIAFQAHKDEALPDLKFNRLERQPRHVQPRIIPLARNTGQPPVPFIGPAMIGADKFFSTAAYPIGNPRRTMTADIVKSPNLTIIPRNDDHAFAQIVKAVPVTRLGDVIHMAYDLPAWPNHLCHFRLEEVRIMIDPAGQALPVQQVKIGCARFNSGCHAYFLAIHSYNNMTNPRQSFVRAEPDARRQSLIEACARCLANLGPGGTSVRAICTEAGVSPGLLRHYFTGIDALIRETYLWTGTQVTAALEDAVAQAGPMPRARLMAYLTASFRPPIASPELLATWLAFWSLTKTDKAIAAVHTEIYRDYRIRLEDLISAVDSRSRDHRLTAVALTALIDGLWLELSLGSTPFTPAEAGILAERWLDSLLG